MKRRNIILYTIIAVLLVCNIISFFTSYNVRQERNSSIATLYPYVQKYTFLKDNIKANIRYASKLLEDSEVTDLHKRSQKLSELFKAGEDRLFLLRISDRYCNSCVEYCVNLFTNDRLRSKFRLCYLTGFQNVGRVDFETKMIGIDANQVFNVLSLNVPIDNAGFPYFMVLNKNLEIEYCYFPTKGYETTDIENLNMILDCYAKKYETL